MTALPAASAWTGAAVTEGGFKAAQNDLRAYLAGLLGTDGNVATALATLGSLLGAGVVTKSSTYTVVAGDRGKLLSCTGTITINLLAAASAGAGFALLVKNDGAGTVTVDGDLSETVDGNSTLVLPGGGWAILVCDGGGWRSIAASVPTSVAVLSGTISHGGTIPLPAGYTEAQCKWMVSMSAAGNGENPITEVDLVSATRTVTARWNNGVSWFSGTANYIIIGVK